MKDIVISFKSIISWRTFMVTFLAVTSTYICIRFSLSADFPLTIIGLAIVFPLVFSINSAYKRREVALKHYATIKAFGRAIYFANCDWIETPDAESLKDLKVKLHNFFNSVNEYFHSEPKEMLTQEKGIYKQFKGLSLQIKDFRRQGMSGSEVSRSNQYLSKIFLAFEELKHIHQYRTPRTLRAYSKVFILILPILYGPYFADVSEGRPTLLTYVLPVLLSIILVSLDNIQEHLENPFDKVGQDDVKINSDKFIEMLD